MKFTHAPVSPWIGFGEHSDRELDKILIECGPQIGEVSWHSIEAPHAAGMIERQSETMRSLIRDHQLASGVRPPRILEVGAYSYYTSYLVASEYGGVGVANDIVAAPLKVGKKAAPLKASGSAVLVASDFHDLPFSDGYFDLVFISSAVHHTFRPWIVLRELLRVTRPGGILHVDNEPVGRLCSFYRYRGNRDEVLTDFEKAIEENGLTRTVSSPFPGSRPEELFGMIENDRIPLQVFESAFVDTEHIRFHLDFEAMGSSLDSALLELPRDEYLVERVVGEIQTRLDHAALAYSEKDLLLGLTLPRREEVWALAYNVADALRSLPAPSDRSYRRLAARLFGAALQATVRKKGGDESSEMFQRNLPEEDGVLIDHAESWSVNLRGALLPSLSDSDARSVFPSEDWELYKEANGVLSLLNLNDHPRIVLPKDFGGGVGVLRYYAAINEGKPYAISVIAEGKKLWSGVACQSESQLARFMVPTGTQELTIALNSLGGDKVEGIYQLHLSTAQILPKSSTSIPFAQKLKRAIFS